MQISTPRTPLMWDIHCGILRIYEPSIWSFQPGIRTTTGPSGALGINSARSPVSCFPVNFSRFFRRSVLHGRQEDARAGAQPAAGTQVSQSQEAMHPPASEPAGPAPARGGKLSLLVVSALFRCFCVVCGLVFCVSLVIFSAAWIVFDMSGRASGRKAVKVRQFSRNFWNSLGKFLWEGRTWRNSTSIWSVVILAAGGSRTWNNQNSQYERAERDPMFSLQFTFFYILNISVFVVVELNKCKSLKIFAVINSKPKIRRFRYFAWGRQGVSKLSYFMRLSIRCPKLGVHMHLAFSIVFCRTVPQKEAQARDHDAGQVKANRRDEWCRVLRKVRRFGVIPVCIIRSKVVTVVSEHFFQLRTWVTSWNESWRTLWLHCFRACGAAVSTVSRCAWVEKTWPARA